MPRAAASPAAAAASSSALLLLLLTLLLSAPRSIGLLRPNPRFRPTVVGASAAPAAPASAAAAAERAPRRLRLRRPPPTTTATSASLAQRGGGGDDDDDFDLKSELADYLRVREEMNADEEAKRQVGKVIGGTKGNPILDYVSGAPNKEVVIEEAPDAFDYGELIKYGYGHLVTPIMDAGGRMEAYRTMGMTPPPLPERVRPESAPELVIDRTGESDPGRYGGLKLGQIVDDDEMGRRLEEVMAKARAGERVRPTLVEEGYVQPFADKRNVGPRTVPEWTPEKIDEQARRRGEALSWARRAREGEYKRDPHEMLSIEGGLRVYCVCAALLVSFAFGRSSPAALTYLGFDSESARGMLDAARVPALGAAVAAAGSGAVCGAAVAPGKNRGTAVWAVKGFLGGPAAVAQLWGLDSLVTRGEAEADAAAAAAIAAGDEE